MTGNAYLNKPVNKPSEHAKRAMRAFLHRLYRFRPLTAAAKRPAPFFANNPEARPAKDGGGVGSGGEEETFGV